MLGIMSKHFKYALFICTSPYETCGSLFVRHAATWPEVTYIPSTHIHIKCFMWACLCLLISILALISYHLFSNYQGRSSRIFIGPAKSPSLSLPFLIPFPPLPPPLPLPPSPPLPPPPLRSRPPFLRLGGLGKRSSSPSGSGRSPAAKRILS